MNQPHANGPKWENYVYLCKEDEGVNRNERGVAMDKDYIRRDIPCRVTRGGVFTGQMQGSFRLYKFEHNHRKGANKVSSSVVPPT
jgi:hypothetical protein